MIGIPGPHGTTWNPDACVSPGCGHPPAEHEHHSARTYCSRRGCDCLRYRLPVPWPLSLVRKLIRKIPPIPWR